MPKKKKNPHKLSFTKKLNERIAVIITTALGSMSAVYLFSVGIIAWMLWQMVDPTPQDPYPYTFLLFILNVLQMVLMPLIMVGQNLLGKYGEKRAEKAYRTTMLNYADLEKILMRLDRQDKELLLQTHLLHNLLKNHIISLDENEDLE